MIYRQFMTLSNLIPASEVVALIGWQNRSSLTRAKQRGDLKPKFKASGATGEEFYDRRDVDRYIAKRAESGAVA